MDPSQAGLVAIGAGLAVELAGIGACRMSTIRRYIYLAIVIVMIRFVLGMASILDMKIEGFIGSVLTGVTFLFLLETIDYFRKRCNGNNRI